MGLLLLLLLGGKVEDAVVRGERAWRNGDYATALTEWGQGLEEARASGDRAAQLDLLLRLGAVNRQLGRLGTAEKTIELAETLATTETEKARILVDRALVGMARGDARKAEGELAKAFQTFQKEGDVAGAATAAMNLGVARFSLGKNAEARKAFEGAGKLFDALTDPGGQASVDVQLARLDRRAGDLKGALDRVEEAVGGALLAQDLATVTEAQLLRGTLLRELGRNEAARASYQAGLDGAKKRKDVVTQARLYNALGGLLHAAGDGRARENYLAAEEGFLAVGDESAALAVAVNAAMLDGTDAAEMRRLLDRAVKVGDPRLEATLALNLAAEGDSSALGRAGKLVAELGLGELVWRHRYLSGKAALEAGKTKEGVKLLKEAVDELERRRRSLDDADAQPFVTRHEDVYEALIDALLHSGDSAGAFVYAQRLQLQDTAPVSDPRLDGLAAEEAYLSDSIAAARDDEQRAVLTERLSALRVEFANTVDTLRSTYADFDRVVRMDPEDLEAIQAELPKGVTVLQPLLFEDRIALLVFSRDRLEAKQIEVDGEEVQKTILRLSRSLQAAHTRDLAWTQKQAEALGGWFIDPVWDALQGSDTLVVSATGPLRELPFAMVRHDGKYLIEHMAVVGVTHVGSLASKHAPFAMAPDRVLLVGNPDGTLPGAETEIARIRARIPAASALVGTEGTREAFEREVRGKRVVHLATHGVIDRDHPSDSYLVLHGDGESGRLSYKEIPGLAPVLSDCRLVILSACQSGLAVDAKHPTDPEGGIVVSINGLAAQFRRAGVETLVASLWRVDDAGTLALMTGLYDELASGGDIGRSLQRAQLRLLADDATAHPWYWAAFVVVGDWR
ncbi:MAG: CHAT domain-containing protein [Alphaproteobacteria bacterium]|nr:CHAT domain-containing protein [Alphaproteobacteria bacterium]